jgi:hypothetical protein
MSSGRPPVIRIGFATEHMWQNNPQPFRHCFRSGTDDDIRLSHTVSMADIEKGLARIDKFSRTLVKWFLPNYHSGG